MRNADLPGQSNCGAIARYSQRIPEIELPRVDIPEKATGQFRYVQNVRLRGMLHGKVVRSPIWGAHVVSVDKSSVTGMAGNPQVVVKNDFVGVVADTEWHVIQAVAALNVTWSSADPLPSSQATVRAGS